MWPGSPSPAAGAGVLQPLSPQTGSAGQSGFLYAARLLHLRLGSELGQEKIQAKGTYLEPFSADADCSLFIVHNCVLYSNLIWAYKQAMDKRGKQH